MQRKKMNKGRLMEYDEYNKREWKMPYSFIFERNGQYIFYFGSRHSYDPKNPQFSVLKKFWNKFLAKTAGKKRIMFEEGGSRPFVADSKESILKYGEMGFMVRLATLAKVIRFSPEPPGAMAFTEFLKQFSKNEIAYHEFAKVCYQWNNMTKKPDFEEYMNVFLKGDKKSSGWKNFDFSIANMIKIQKKIFGTKFNKNDREFFYSIINPTTKKSVINRISRFEDEKFRDDYILGQIEKYWKNGYNIFLIYGSSHAIRQESAIRTLG